MIFAIASCIRVAPVYASADEQTNASMLPLDGAWRFTIDDTKPLADWDTLPVPGNWDMFNEYAHFKGVGHYQRTFDLPAAWKAKHIRLHFDAVAGTAEVSLNGESLGQHVGGFTPFEFDVTDRVRWDQPNTLIVASDNTVSRGAFWDWGGISRDVSLIAGDDLRIVFQHAWAEPDLASGTAHVTDTIRIANDSANPLPAAIDTRIDDTGATSQTSVMAPPHAAVDVPVTFALAKDQVRLWDFDHPNLYQITTQVKSGDQVEDTRQDHFGIRKIEVTPNGLFLNGERVRLNGFNRVGDHRAYGATEPEFLVKGDVDLMKRYGANLMRIMHMPQAPNLLDYLDQQGMLIFEEIPVWGGNDPNIRKDNPLTRQWLTEMIDRDFNHPSIIGWSVGNEMRGQGSYVRSMIPFIRDNLDSHRLLTYVSNSALDYSIGAEPEDVSSLILLNFYGGLATPAKKLHEKWPDKPIFFSECGAGMFGDSLASRIPNLDNDRKGMGDLPYLIGASLWTFNDYRSAFKGSSPSELRAWGVVDQWRQPKAAAQQIAAIDCPVTSLTVEANTIRLAPRGKDDLPSFTLRNYDLKWEWIQPNGAGVGGSVVALPNIAPGDAELTFNAGAAPADAAGGALVADLIAPTGYVVAESDGDPFTGPTPAHDPAKPGELDAPLIRCVYPVDGGCMVAYKTMPGDFSTTIQYGAQSGAYTQELTADMPGAMRLRGLTNGQKYFLRVRRNTASGPGAWSDELTVTPDGGLPPRAPTLYSVVRGPGGLAAVRFEIIDKAIGYVVNIGGRTVDVPTAAAGVAVLHDVNDPGAVAFTVRAVNVNGQSPESNSISATVKAQ